MIVVLIPCYRPDSKLTNLVQELKNLGQEYICIVDDGNQNSSHIFSELENMGCMVVHHATNLGKGRALKTGFNALMLAYPKIKGVVTADADGQHLSSDIINLVKELEATNNLQEIVLGSRVFDKDTPLRSKIGNYMTSAIFKTLIGLKISDTQTGLRAIPKDLLTKMMRLDGERYEFETNMLLFCKEGHIAIREIAISTVYLDDNASSSFNPFFDSMKIYFLLLRFIMSSLSATTLDFVLFGIFFSFSKHLFLSLAIARSISIIFNFYTNLYLVFKSIANPFLAFTKYTVLAISLFTVSYLSLKYLPNYLPVNILAIKIIVESTLFAISYGLQRDIIFKKSININ